MRANSASNGRLERNSKTKKPDDTIKVSSAAYQERRIEFCCTKLRLAARLAFSFVCILSA